MRWVNIARSVLLHCVKGAGGCCAANASRNLARLTQAPRFHACIDTHAHCTCVAAVDLLPNNSRAEHKLSRLVACGGLSECGPLRKQEQQCLRSLCHAWHYSQSLCQASGSLALHSSMSDERTFDASRCPDELLKRTRQASISGTLRASGSHPESRSSRREPSAHASL